MVSAAAARREASQLHAMELEQLAAYARAREGDEFAYLEVATLLHLSDRAAADRLEFALTLTARLPRTLATLREGLIDEDKARLIAEAVRAMTAGQAAEIEALVLDRAAEQTPAELREALARARRLADWRA